MNLHLFQGDSITDTGRVRTNDGSLGNGYAFITAARYGLKHPRTKLRFINRGISGNRSRDLEARWTNDCVALQPTTLSILIGVNDTWRRYDSNDPTPADRYEEAYRRLLTRVRDETRARVILLEPFLLDVPKVAGWREDLDPKRAIVRALASEFGATFIPLDTHFANAARETDPAFWAEDGVHPTPAGHALIADHLLAAVEGMY